VLLLFGGGEGTQSPAALLDLVRSIGSYRAGDIAAHLVLAALTRPASAGDTGEVLLDPCSELHKGWHANAGDIYLVRPDGYVGYRAASADAARVARYLDSVFS
jgi:hypothetical protein